MITEEQKKQLLEKCVTGIDVYPSYDDIVNSHFVSCILARHDEISSTYMEAFKDELYNWFNPNDNYRGVEEDVKDMCKDVGIDTDEIDEEDYRTVWDLVAENLWYKPDYDHYLNQKVCIDIFIDAGDYNYDLGCNQVYPHYDGRKEEPIADEFCLYWLTKTQGYTKEELEKNLYNDENLTNKFFEGVYDENFTNKFFESVYDELNNCTSHMNSLVFLKRMTLREYLNMMDSKEPVHINKDTRCGLFDKWSGAGGLLDIHLEKDIDIPRENIHEITDDGQFRYNIHEVYGVDDSFWED